MIFAYIDTFFSLLPILFFILYWKQAKPERGSWLIVIYSFFFFCINILISNWNKIPLLYDSNTLVEFLLFSAFLYAQFRKPVSKTVIAVTALIYSVFYLLFLFYARNVEATNAIPMDTAIIDSIPIGVETIIILSFSFYYLYERMKDTSTLFIYNTYQFWVVVGMVLYLAGSFFIYIFSNYLSGAEVKKYWVITNFFSILRSVFFAIAIIHQAKPTKNKIVSDYEISYIN